MTKRKRNKPTMKCSIMKNGKQCPRRGQQWITSSQILCDYHFLELRKEYREDKPGPEFYGITNPFEVVE